MRRLSAVLGLVALAGLAYAAGPGGENSIDLSPYARRADAVRVMPAAIPASNTVTAQTETAFATKATILAGNLTPGTLIRDIQWGVYTSSGLTPSITPRIRLGGVSLLPSRAITGLLASTNVPWRAETIALVTDSGIVSSTLLTIDDNQIRIFGGTAVTGVNAAIDNDFTSSAQWGQANCSITLQGRLTEILKPAS